MLSFGIERIEQSGKTYNINGETIKARKKTSNKWFETQDSISYWEDFCKPKIIYPDISQNLSFSIDANGYFIGNTAYFMSAINLEYLLHILNSKLIDWYYRTLSVQLGEKAVRMFSIYVLKLPIPLWLNTELQNAIKSEEPSNDINRMVYEIYNLDNKEMEFIEFQ